MFQNKMVNIISRKSLLTIAILSALATEGFAVSENIGNPFAVINSTSNVLYYSYSDAVKETHSGSIPADGLPHMIFQNVTNLASGKTYLTVSNVQNPTNDQMYCNVNGDDFYHPLNNPTKSVEYPVIINSAWAEYAKNKSIDQPFVQHHTTYSNLVLITPVIENAGTIDFQSAHHCLVNIPDPVKSALVIDSHVGSLSGVDSSVDVLKNTGDPVNVDMGNMFIDKVPAKGVNNNPDPNDPADFVGTIIQPSAALPSGFSLTAIPKATYTSWSLSVPTSAQPGTQLTFNACDTNMSAANAFDSQGNMYPGMLGLCQPATGGGFEPKPGFSATAKLTVNVIDGVIAKSPDDIVADYAKNNKSDAQPLLTTDIDETKTPLASITIPHINQFFKSTSDAAITYQVIDDDTPVDNRNDGDTPWTSTITVDGPNKGAHWGPALLRNDQPHLSLSASSFPISSDGTLSITPTPQDLSTINNMIGRAHGAVIQLTIRAHTDEKGATNPDAFQTIYLVIRQQATYTLLDKNHVQAWLYPPNDVASGTAADPKRPNIYYNPNALFQNDDAGDYSVSAEHSTCNYITKSPGRLLHYIKTLEDSWPTDGSTDKYGISEITPDIGWIDAYGGNWFDGAGNPKVTDLYADTPTNPTAGCLASYFKYNASQAAHPYPMKFLVTEEFGPSLATLVGTGNLEAWQRQLVIQALSIDGNQLAWNKLQTKPQNYYSPGAADPYLIDGIQFDVEPFKNSVGAHEIYKGIADLLAREGKINEIYAFADADNPALIEAQGPLGKFLLSSYDVEDNTPSSPATNPAHSQYNGGAPGFWGDGNITTDTPDDGTAPTFAGIPLLYPSQTAQDFACHYNSKGPDQNYVSNSWCSANLADLAFGNVNKFNGKYGTGDESLDFSQMNTEYDGHFMLSVPSEGSATSWAYDIQFSPRTTPDSLDDGKHYVVSAVPNTYKAIYAGLDFGYGVQMGTTVDGKQSLVTAIQKYVAANGYPQPGTYDVFYNINDVTGSRNDNTCSWSTAPVAGYPYCVAILESHANGAADGDFSLTSKDPLGPLVNTDTLASTTPAPAYSPESAYDDLNMLTPSTLNGQDYIANQLQVIYDQANTTADTNAVSADSNSYAPTTSLGTPATNPTHNVGVAMYGISDISVEDKNAPGLFNQGSIGTSDPTQEPALNKGVQFPVSFDGRPEQTDQTRNLWTLTDNYMNGITGQINGGSTPPPPVTKPIATPDFINDTDEQFTVEDLPLGQTCKLTVSYPDSSKTPFTINSLKDGNNDSSGMESTTDFIGSDYKYTWAIYCGSDTTPANSGTFYRYGDQAQVCITGGTLTTPECAPSLFDELATQVPSYKFPSLANGTYTITYEPASLNDMTATDHNTLVHTTLSNTTVTVNNDDNTEELSFVEN